MSETSSERPESSMSRPTTPPPRNPLPKFQLFICLLVQFTEPVTATVIYPFVNQFVQETGVTKGDEKKIGYYAGVIESCFFLTEALTVFHWGRASDYVGRKPILLLGPLGLGLAMMRFGLSRTFMELFISRCFQGVFNGNIGVSKTVLAEITDTTNIAEAFGMIPMMWSIGTTIGPIMGGLLARPATTWPTIFGGIKFFQDYPYFLPCFAAAITAFLSAFFAGIGLKETLPSLVSKRERELRKGREAPAKASATEGCETSLLTPDHQTSYGTLDTAEYQPEEPIANTEPVPFKDLLTPQVLTTLGSYLFLTFTDMASQVLRPLMYSTSIEHGGLGFSPYRIGLIMGVYGFLNAAIQMHTFPPMVRRFGARTLFIVSYGSLLGIIGMYPIIRFFARRAGEADVFVWMSVILQLSMQSMIYMAYGSIQILIVHSAPNPASLGSTNGLAQSLGCASRALAPTFSTSLFSLSLERNLAGGNMVYFVLLFITLIGIRVTFMLPRLTQHQHS